MILIASLWKKRSLLSVLPFVLTLSGAQSGRTEEFRPPKGIMTVGLRETERHRAPIPVIRIVQGESSSENVTFWVHVDEQGNVIEVRGFKIETSWPVKYSSDELSEAIHKITYQPFLRNGAPVEAWVQDEIGIGAKPMERVSSGAEASFPEPKNPTDFSIQLSRSGCYGTCPSYTVVVRGDGKIEFHGGRFVAIPGDHQARIDPEEAARLLERFRGAGFFELKDNYVAGVTDNPTYRLELIVGAKKKTVVDYVGDWVGMPVVVTELEDAVDEAAGTDRWVSAGPKTMQAMQDAGIIPTSKQAGEILIYAVKQGKADEVRTLLAAGVPVMTDATDRRSVLREASFVRDRDKQREVFKALLENAEVRADKERMRDALGSVAGNGNIESARTLIAAGADATQLFHETYDLEGKPDQTYLMRAATSGVWEMIDDALSRPHDIHAVDHLGRSALGHVLWSAPPAEDIFPLVDRLLVAGAGKSELTRTLADSCDRPQWRDGLIKRGADPAVCKR